LSGYKVDFPEVDTAVFPQKKNVKIQILIAQELFLDYLGFAELADQSELGKTELEVLFQKTLHQEAEFQFQ
jgi:predicted NUDIX family NTP pyrophosphohydrolase